MLTAVTAHASTGAARRSRPRPGAQPQSPSGPPPRRWPMILRALGSLLPRRRRAATATHAAPSRRGARERVAAGTSTSRDTAAGRIVRPWREDASRLYPTSGLTPTRALAFLQAADGGHPLALFELFHDMLQKWPRLAAVEATRRLALTGLDWEIVPHATPGMSAADRVLAERAAELCRSELGRLDVLREALAHLAAAIGSGLAVVELVWEAGRLIDLTPVPHSRFIADAREPWRVRIRTAENPTVGVALDEQPAKWIVHDPHASSGRPFDGGLLRASLLLFVAQSLSFKHWLSYSEIAGMPVRVARFDPGTPEDEKQQLLRMLQSLGTDAAAAFCKNIELELLESSRSTTGPYEALQSYCNTEVTILWLGQHLTTDIRNSGSRAAAEVHDRVREDLLVQDIADEGRTIRRDLLTPLVRSQLGGDAPTPHFRRSLVQSVDTKVFAETLAVAVNELGLRVPAAWVHKALGIPQAEAGAAAVTGVGR